MKETVRLGIELTREQHEQLKNSAEKELLSMSRYVKRKLFLGGGAE